MLVGDELRPVLEDHPPRMSHGTRGSPAGPTETMSLSQIRQEKERRRQEALHGDDVWLPSWVASVVNRTRGTLFFRECVAREPETPLTSLHLMQPLLGLLLFGAMALLLFCVATAIGLLALSVDSIRALEVVVSLLAVFASAALLSVGLVARGVPTQEKLNVQLNGNIDGLEESVEAAKANADDAEKLGNLTLGWVKARGADRDGVRALRDQLQRDTAELWAFQFKAMLLRYLSRGERHKYQQENAELLHALRETPSTTLAQYEAQREKLLPNGRLSIPELQRVAEMVRQTEQESAYDFLDEVIFAFIDDVVARQQEEGQAKDSECL
ncbi:hypothetical protein AB1Y20_018794 [Prymnesium parvum]|uniref:Transmembrane protein n=1 Tax=Prymnesium parvum TaxID=97485 RepID=A0AB34JPN3_PRYPA